MPTILFHELVGNKIAKNDLNLDTNDFYLGLMVPDSVNAYGFASKEDRWRTHVRDENLDKWQKNIIDFYKKNKENYEETYLKGYLIHVLTDIICDKIYQNELYPNLIKEGFDYNTAYKHYEEGIFKLECNNIDQKWWQEVKQKIKSAKILPICGMNKQMIEDEIKYTLTKYSKMKKENIGYLKEDFADKVVENIYFILNTYIK